MAECPVCHVDHSTTTTTCDYEPCGYCGFDHSYEYEQAYAWHIANPCSYCRYDHALKLHETDCCVAKHLPPRGNHS